MCVCVCVHVLVLKHLLLVGWANKEVSLEEFDRLVDEIQNWLLRVIYLLRLHLHRPLHGVFGSHYQVQGPLGWLNQ